MILQRYILRELVSSFLFAFAAMLAVCLVGTMFQVFRAFEGSGFLLFVKALPLAVGYVALWAVLVSACTAATLVYGRLAADNEINAMRTTGIHASRIVFPAVVFGLALSGGTWFLNNDLLPYVRHERRNAFREATAQILKAPPPGKRTIELGPFKLTYLDFRDGKMVKPTLSQFENDRFVIEYFAPEGTIRADENPPKIIMSKPRFRQIDPKTGAEHLLSAESDVTIPLDLGEIGARVPRDEDLALGVLIRKIASTQNPKMLRNLLTILHTRVAQSLAPLLLVLVAVPVGILVRRGSRLAGLGAALPPLLLYFVAFFVLQGLGRQAKVSPFIAAYGPDALLLGLAAGLLFWVGRK